MNFEAENNKAPKEKNASLRSDACCLKNACWAISLQKKKKKKKKLMFVGGRRLADNFVTPFCSN